MEEKWISLNEFMRRNNIGQAEALRLLNSGKIEYQKSESGRYRIKVGRKRKRQRKGNTNKRKCRAKSSNKQFKSNFKGGELDGY